MREILFKAKRKDNDEWIYGYPMRHPQAVQVGPYEPYWDMFVPPADPDDTGGVFRIDPDTLCQYIGLKDENGKRIWENDIVYIRNSGLSGYGTVEYKNGCLVVKDVKRGRTYSLFGEWQLRVDGNKFDNPELLKPNTLTES